MNYCAYICFCKTTVSGIPTSNGSRIMISSPITVIKTYCGSRVSQITPAMKAERGARRVTADRVTFIQGLRSSANQFSTLLPVVGGVILLMGLFITFVSADFLTSIFQATWRWIPFGGHALVAYLPETPSIAMLLEESC